MPLYSIHPIDIASNRAKTAVTDVVESHFGFDHPKFGQMAWCVGVLRTERRAESINGTQSRGPQLSFQLSGYGQRSRLAEEIVGIVYLSFVVLLQS